MYSGQLLLVVSLYGILFDDDKYDEPGELTFDWNPIFVWMGPRSSLTAAPPCSRQL